VSHWGHSAAGGPTALQLLAHNRARDVRVPLLVFATGDHAEENKQQLLRSGGLGARRDCAREQSWRGRTRRPRLATSFSADLTAPAYPAQAPARSGRSCAAHPWPSFPAAARAEVGVPGPRLQRHSRTWPRRAHGARWRPQGRCHRRGLSRSVAGVRGAPVSDGHEVRTQQAHGGPGRRGERRRLDGVVVAPAAPRSTACPGNATSFRRRRRVFQVRGVGQLTEGR
jgi:hypothetical protein